jgi:hypothetical protein
MASNADAKAAAADAKAFSRLCSISDIWSTCTLREPAGDVAGGVVVRIISDEPAPAAAAAAGAGSPGAAAAAPAAGAQARRARVGGLGAVRCGRALTRARAARARRRRAAWQRAARRALHPRLWPKPLARQRRPRRRCRPRRRPRARRRPRPRRRRRRSSSPPPPPPPLRAKTPPLRPARPQCRPQRPVRAPASHPTRARCACARARRAAPLTRARRAARAGASPSPPREKVTKISNLVRELRKEVERLMGMEHWEAAEIVVTEALVVRARARVRRVGNAPRACGPTG